MSRRRIFLKSCIIFSAVVFADQPLDRCRAREISNRNRTRSSTREQWRREFERNSQQRRREMDRQRMQRLQQYDKIREQVRKDADKRRYESIKEVLKITEEQWSAIKPKLESVGKLMDESDISVKIGTMAGAGAGVRVGGYGSGTSNNRRIESDNRSTTQNTLDIPTDENGEIKIQYSWAWHRPWSFKAPDEWTEGEKICDELFNLLEDENSKPEEIEQKIEALRKIRHEADQQLVKARKELRELLTFRQEKMLIMTGWLD